MLLNPSIKETKKVENPTELPTESTIDIHLITDEELEYLNGEMNAQIHSVELEHDADDSDCNVVQLQVNEDDSDYSEDECEEHEDWDNVQ